MLNDKNEIMRQIVLLLLAVVMPFTIKTQDLTEGLLINDLSLHPMQDIEKPGYLDMITDPAFGTTIRRITNAAPGQVIVPMYSTIQAWNADESMMILYNQSSGKHELLNGMTYQFVRVLDDVDPIDLEQIFWDFSDPDILYYPDDLTYDFIRYTISTQSKEVLVNLASLTSCNDDIEMGNDIQMMSWDSDVFTFRCGNDTAYAYQISTGVLSSFNIQELNFTAPTVAPSGTLFYHDKKVYDSNGNSIIDLNKNAVEHSCVGKLSNGNDAFYSIAFQEGPEGGCIGDIIAHDLVTGECIPIISQNQGYDYPQSGTHISSLAHKNTNPGWVAASMIGYDQNGQELLDQELVIARAINSNVEVCRIGHHRSDEDQFDYWGEPHAVISPTGTRVLFASDWSGEEDGLSVDSYVVELPAHTTLISTQNQNNNTRWHRIYPNPVNDRLTLELENTNSREIISSIYNATGKRIYTYQTKTDRFNITTQDLGPGIYFYKISDNDNEAIYGRFIKQ